MHPLPDLRRFTASDKLVLFGGSFDPPHLAHGRLPVQVAAGLGAAAVLYIPARRSPHKPDQAPVESHHRLAMLEVMLEGDAGLRGGIECLLWPVELEREGPSYTVDTVEDLAERTPARLRLLIGADQAVVFDSWRAAARIAELAEPAVMVRPPDTTESVSEKLPMVWHDRLVAVGAMEVSSTEIRTRLSGGASAQAMADDGLLHPAVAAYIEREGLYR